jgi:phosphoribosylformylglycinamidine synthase
MGQFVGCLEGIGEAARALDFPIVSGNVSLYNETQGTGILPTPAIGGVGVISDVALAATIALPAGGKTILLVGATRGWLGQSLYLRDLADRRDGAPPPVDLSAEKRNGDFVRALVLEQRALAVHDLSDGGLAVALAEMAIAGGVGATIARLPAGSAHAILFGEDQARFLIVAEPAEAEAIEKDAKAAGVEVLALGVTGGNELHLPGEAPILLCDMQHAQEAPLPAYMAGEEDAFARGFRRSKRNGDGKN